MNSLLGVIEIFYLCLGGLLGFLLYTRYNLGVGIYVIMGIILGPSLLNCVSISYLSNTLSSIGILFVLFEIGLHLSYEKIILLKQYLLSTTVSIGLSILIVASALFFFIPKIYLLVTMLLCVSSTPIIFHILNEKNKLYTKTGRFIFTTMLLQDILSITTLVKTIIILAILSLLGKKIINNLFKKLSCSFEFILLVSFLIIIGLSLLTEHFGLSLELGAVLAGFLLAETDYSMYIESQIVPIKQMLLSVFFMTMGMYFPLKFMLNNLTYSLLFFSGTMILKFTGLFIGARLLLLNTVQSITASLMLLSVGEVIFIFISKIFPNFSSVVHVSTLNYLSIITVLSLIVTPILFYIFFYFYHTKTEVSFGEHKKFVIIGFNDVTEVIIKALNHSQTNYICLENSIKVVNDHKTKNFNIVLSNYTDSKTVSKTIKASVGVFFSSPPPLSLLQQIQSYTKENIYVKVKDSKEEEYYRALNVIPIRIDVYDEAFKVCSIVMENFGIDNTELEKIFLAIT
jgi:CPA2 family monovalent cation:H+ antiporter-2